MSTAAHIAIEMLDAGLPESFVLRAVAASRESEGIEDLLYLWRDASDAESRRAAEADIAELLEDREPAPSPEPSDLESRKQLKLRLRALVDQHGGVSEVARRAEMPQPSLSRILGDLRTPRASTLARLAAAMEIPVAVLVGGPKEPSASGPAGRPPGRARPQRWAPAERTRPLLRRQEMRR